MATYNKVALKTTFSVTHIIEIFYRALPKESRIGGGGMYDFWRLYYVDRGNVDFYLADGTIVTIQAGQGIFFAPNLPFSHAKTTMKNANLLSLFFICPKLDDAFHKKTYSFDTFERTILSNLILTGRTDFERHSNHPDGPKGQKPKADAPADTLPFVKASTEHLLLLLQRKKTPKPESAKLPAQNNNLLVNMAIEFMYRNADKKLTVRDIATHVKMSEPNFRAIFKKHTSESVMEYFHELKIEHAKMLIRQNIYTQGEIASALNYSSVSYFCRHFKQKTGMTPTEYARLIYYG